MRTSFKNKIALNFTLSTALLIAVTFLVIYYIVNFTVFNRLEKDVMFEADRHFYEVGIQSGVPYIADKVEWMEREHQALEINPVFIQLTDQKGKVLEKSPNLKSNELTPDFSQPDKTFFRSKLTGQAVAQVQVTLKEQGNTAGYLIVAIPIDESENVLFKLKIVLLVAFPVVLIALFFVTRFIAGRSIQPVLSVIDTASKITNQNLTARIELPAGQDELHTLVVTINDLMDRIENAVDREKQFTADASHELRTPLAIIKGTLEVLIRKPRTSEEYVEKVAFSISEINRISYLVDQLLLLARFESQKKAMDYQKADLAEITASILHRQQQHILDKALSIDLETDGNEYVYSDTYMLDIIIENLVSNAVKYSHKEGSIKILIKKVNEVVQYSITDKGIGIDAVEIEKIREPFYRSQPLQHADIKGNGLGLSIVTRMCELLQINFSVESQLNEGTSVTLSFNS